MSEEKHPGSLCYCDDCDGDHPHPCGKCGDERSDHCYFDGRQHCRECRTELMATPRGQMLQQLDQERFDRYDEWKRNQ